MKHVWKALGVAALLAGLSPYRVTTDTATGDKKIRALLWKVTYGGQEKKGLTLSFGFFPPNEEEEPHLYADELVVHYHNGQPCGADEAAGEAEEPCCGSEESADAPEEAPAEAEAAPEAPEQEEK